MSIHWFGYVGTTLVILAYLPQITHLIRETCSAGMSFGAYAIWVVAAVLLLTYAILTRDPVFIALQSYQVLATGLICFYCKRYEHNLCELHGGLGRGGGRRPTRSASDNEGR
jgi:uncharacterized protein with PQ loop repeat